MARKVTELIELTDDIDGGKADVTVAFTWDGTPLEIDLSKKNATAFTKLLKPYVEASRNSATPRPRTTRTTKKAAAVGRRSDLDQVRAWAAENGLQVSSRGRIAGSVLETYDSAHA